MDAQKFLAEFGHIANAPGGVGRLRELVLQLAISGKLTNQVIGEDAADFLDEIKATREALQADGAIRVNRKVRSEECHGGWPIPPNWIWCRLGELCNFVAGKTPSRKEAKYWNSGDYPWLSIADLKHGQVVAVSGETVSEIARTEVFKSEPSPAGSLLMSFKLSIGKLSLLGFAAYHNEAIITIDPFSKVLKEYFFKCLNGFDLSAGNKAAIKGNTLNQDSLSNIFVALPPKNEISRIVAKVDELMALCDQLEAQQQARRTLQNHLRQATLQTLASATSPHELQTSWKRLADNFGQLFQEPEDVGDFRKTILTLAFRGKLGSVSEITRYATLASILAEASVNGVSKGPTRDTSAVEVLKISAGTSRADFNVDEDDFKHVDLSAEEVEKFRLLPGDLLSCRYNGNLHYVGRFSYYRGQTGRTQVNPDKLIRFRIASEHDPRYACLVINSEPARQIIEAMCATTAGNIGLSAGKLKTIEIPLPSLLEQRCIVQHVEDLMSLCDSLEAQLRGAQKVGGRLVNSAVSAFTGITPEQQEPPMKAPQTELLAPMRLGAAPDIKA